VANEQVSPAPRIAARPARDIATGALEAMARVSAWLGGLFLLATALLVAAQILARLAGAQIPSADDVTAWFLAGSVLLALPYALRQGSHIRVTLLLHMLPAGLRRFCEVLSNVAALILAGWAAWHCTGFVQDSFLNNEVSQGIVALPMWIPQLSMPVGLWGLFAMLAGRLAALLSGSPWPEEDHG